MPNTANCRGFTDKRDLLHAGSTHSLVIANGVQYSIYNLKLYKAILIKQKILSAVLRILFIFLRNYIDITHTSI